MSEERFNITNPEPVPHNFKSKYLYEMIIGHTPGDSVDISLDGSGGKIVRIVAMENDWDDILFNHGGGERFRDYCLKEDLDPDFYQSFMVDTPERWDSGETMSLKNSLIYVDQPTYELIFRNGIISSHRIMPQKLYDLAYDEVNRLSESV